MAGSASVVCRTEIAQFLRWVASAILVALVSACGRENLELFPGYGVLNPDAATSPEAPIVLLEGGIPCQTDSECHGENHRCQTGLHVCVQCIGDPTDCAVQGNESKCNLVNYTCAVPCAPDGGCAGGDVCDSQGVCADCLVSSHCPASQPRCVLEECVCLSNADCDGGVCGPDQTCK